MHGVECIWLNIINVDYDGKWNVMHFHLKQTKRVRGTKREVKIGLEN